MSTPILEAKGIKKQFHDPVTVDVLKDGSSWKVVANLPYNISTAVLFRLLEVRERLARMIGGQRFSGSE